MAALVCVMTMAISVYIPASNGFFNIGESIVYLSAILFGPYIGALSGGIGSMVADLLLGYYYYAPGTLIIKGIEGFVVGYLYKKLSSRNTEKKDNKTIVLLISSLISSGILVIGILYYIGEAEFFGFNFLVFITDIGHLIWIIIALGSFIGINLIHKFSDPNTSIKMISMFIGGLVIILGYFLYGTFILNQYAAYLEIPFNILQSLIGIIIAIPIINPIRKILRI
jgi:uncharacterized membrane protein